MAPKKKKELFKLDKLVVSDAFKIISISLSL